MSINQYFLFAFCVLFFSCKKPQAFGNSDSKNLEIQYVDSIYNVRLQTPNDSLGREKLLEVASEYENRGLFIESKQALEEIFKRATKKKDTLHQAKVYWYLGNVYDNQQKLDSAFLCYTKAEKLYNLTKKDSLNWGRMISYKAGILYNMGISAESEVQTIRALNILNKSRNTRLIYEATLRMALNLKNLKEYDEALNYYDKIPGLLNRLENEKYNSNRIERSWLSYYNNMGNFYIETNNYLIAKEYLDKALSQKYVENYPKLYAMLLNNYAKNSIYSINDEQIIDSLLNTSLKIREEIGHKQGIIGSKVIIGEYLLSQQDTLNALRNFNEAYTLSVKYHSNYNILRSLELLSINDKENQILYTEKYHKVKDSLYELERATRNKFARIAYETDEIEEKNTMLTKRNSYLLGIVLFISLLASLIFILFRLKTKNKELMYQQKEQNNIQQIQELLLQQQTITVETKAREQDRIAKDLHDGVLNRLFTTRINLEELKTDDTSGKNQLIEELQKTESQIREVSHNLHKNLFSQQQDFSLVIENLVLKQKNTFGTVFNCSINKKIKWERFNIKEKTNIYLIIQEMLQNVNKHSQAKKCFVFILEKENSLIIRVHDDGIGFRNNQEKTGLGLNSIKYRLSGLKGQININSKANNTVVSLQIVLDKSQFPNSN